MDNSLNDYNTEKKLKKNKLSKLIENFKINFSESLKLLNTDI